MKRQTNYRVDGGSESYYTNDKSDANRQFDQTILDFGEPVTMWEIIEEWNDKENDWEQIDENIIRSTINPFDE